MARPKRSTVLSRKIAYYCKGKGKGVKTKNKKRTKCSLYEQRRRNLAKARRVRKQLYGY